MHADFDEIVNAGQNAEQAPKALTPETNLITRRVQYRFAFYIFILDIIQSDRKTLRDKDSQNNWNDRQRDAYISYRVILFPQTSKYPSCRSKNLSPSSEIRFYLSEQELYTYSEFFPYALRILHKSRL